MEARSIRSIGVVGVGVVCVKLEELCHFWKRDQCRSI